MVQRTNKIRVSGFSLGLTALATLAACSSAQTPATPASAAPTPGPAIWTLSDNDTTLYLFGYAQVLPTGTDWQSDTFRSAFAAADTLIMESDGASPEAQAEAQRLAQSLGLRRDETTLSDDLTPAQAEEIGAFTQSLGVPLQALAPMRPWLANVQVGVMTITQRGYDLTASPQLTLVADAKARGMALDYLEAPTDLMQVMAGMPVEIQARDFAYSVAALRDRPDEIDQLAEAWLSGDVEQIGALLHGPAGAWSDPALYKAMLVKRNAAWADRLATLMDTETGTYFVAVGFGHLAGPDSLVTMLEASGNTVQRQ